ncbi:unnamed protein product [Adineta steineri]|uniref:Apple domain-containing protein n=1 Tax=Adineta steineri TaxID=433720 RepID=A0A814QWG2_9BILA|nr:unnamed protein product [Adineta steineri]CAF1528303.1 unnamed protein product [Adineta steineri]
MMSKIVGWQFNCASTTCLPFSTLTVSDIFKCELACLAQIQCEAISFHQSTTKCELFANIPNQNGNMLANIDVVTMIVIDQTRFPAEPVASSSILSSTSAILTTNDATSPSTSLLPSTKINTTLASATINTTSVSTTINTTSMSTTINTTSLPTTVGE